MARTTPNSERAEQHLRSALRDFGGGGADLGVEIIDVFTNPRRAARDGVIVTPMLIGLKTSGRLVMMGDLGDAAKLRSLIQSLVDDRTIEAMQALVAGKNASLDEKETMATELKHRVRNHLHLVQSMLAAHLQITSGAAERDSVLIIIRRVATLIGVYNQLLGVDLGRTVDLGEYITSLCVSLPELQLNPHKAIKLICAADSLFIDVETVTVLGMVVAEAVSNCFKYAFHDNRGTINVSLRRSETEGKAFLVVRDDGCGFAEQPGSKRHGVGLLRRLVERVNGTAELSLDHGAVWTFRFPVGAPAPPGRLVDP